MRLDAARRAEVPMVCPFVAFADERDLRADEPDHRHRCYAEAYPAPRALAHQERYCLSPGFTSCPIFQDWAVRSAAEVEGGAGRMSTGAARTAGAAELPGLFDEPAAAPTPARSSVSAASYEEPASGPRGDATFGQEETGDWVDEEGESALSEGAFAGASRVAPWDRPRRREAYPRLRRSGANIPPLFWGAVGLAVAAGLLFLLPSFITGFFSGGGIAPTASPTPTSSATPAGPTAEPAPTPLVYTVQKGDTLSGIASKFDVTLEELRAANPQISDPDLIKVGDKITISTPAPEGSPGESPAP